MCFSLKLKFVKIYCIKWIIFDERIKFALYTGVIVYFLWYSTYWYLIILHSVPPKPEARSQPPSFFTPTYLSIHVLTTYRSLITDESGEESPEALSVTSDSEDCAAHQVVSVSVDEVYRPPTELQRVRNYLSPMTG